MNRMPRDSQQTRPHDFRSSGAAYGSRRAPHLLKTSKNSIVDFVPQSRKINTIFSKPTWPTSPWYTRLSEWCGDDRRQDRAAKGVLRRLEAALEIAFPRRDRWAVAR